MAKYIRFDSLCTGEEFETSYTLCDICSYKEGNCCAAVIPRQSLQNRSVCKEFDERPSDEEEANVAIIRFRDMMFWRSYGNKLEEELTDKETVVKNKTNANRELEKTNALLNKKITELKKNIELMKLKLDNYREESLKSKKRAKKRAKKKVIKRKKK